MQPIQLKALRILSILTLAVAPSFGNILYVSSGDGSGGNPGSVVTYDSLTGAYLQTLINTNLSNPRGITIDAGILYVAETTFSQANGSGSIKRFNATTGAYMDTILTGLNTPEQIDFHDGYFYFTQFSQGDNLLYRADPGNSWATTVFAQAGALGNAGYQRPDDFLFAPDGFLYITTANTISKHNATTGAFIETVATGKRYRGLTWGTDGELYYTESTTASNTVGQVGGSVINSVNIARDIITNSAGQLIVAIRGNASLTPGTRLGKYSFSGSYTADGFFDDGAGSLFLPSFMYIEEASGVPEPGSILLLAGGLSALVMRRRIRK
jgi:hypothetical protein